VWGWKKLELFCFKSCCVFRNSVYICTPQTRKIRFGIEGRKVHIYVDWVGEKKEKIFFFKISCQVKKQLYICSRLGKHLRETKRGSREVYRRVYRSSLKYCGDKNRVRVRTWTRGTRIKETYNLVYVV